MNRREIIAGLGSAAAWPLAARSQQAAMPVVGFLDPAQLGAREEQVIAFRRGLVESGYVEGRNVAIEYRWGEERNDTFAALAFDLVQRQVAAIATFGNAMTLAAAKATRTIPIVFSVGLDPVEYGLVVSLARPGGNATGFTSLTKELVGKGISLLHEIVPVAASIAFLYDTTTEVYERENVQNAARILGIRLLMIGADSPSDIEPAFADMVQQRAGALYVSPAPKLNARNDQIAALALRHAIPAIFTARTAVHAGGLMSYGTFLDRRQAGIYTGRILKGEKPADLPVLQPTKFNLVINLKTAKALGLTIPETLLATADEIIQ
jgi:putative ABC transport system substrate-binding protein